MKKKLIDSCRVRPYTSGAAIDRQNFGSAVLGLKVAAATGSPTADCWMLTALSLWTSLLRAARHRSAST